MPNVTGTGASTQASQTASGIGMETPQNGFLWPNTPNIIDFFYWLYTNVTIPAAALPATSPYPQYALSQALALVLCVPNIRGISYTLAVYNAGTHVLLGIAPDQPGQNFFTAARANSGCSLVNPSDGLIAASSDEGTSVTLKNPKWVEGLTVSQLGFYKTPWGREYLSYNQSMGPTIWGLT